VIEFFILLFIFYLNSTKFVLSILCSFIVIFPYMLSKITI
jgi:hypothetical protein